MYNKDSIFKTNKGGNNMDSEKWEMKSIGKKIQQILLAVIIVTILAFAIKEVRDVLALWSMNYPTIREIALYALSTIIVAGIALVGFIVYNLD